LAEKSLEKLPTGGNTPLSKGLYLAHVVLTNSIRKDSHMEPILVLISDGKANVTMGGDQTLDNSQRITRFWYSNLRRFWLPSLLNIIGGNALEEAKEIAHWIRLSGIRSIVIDTESGLTSSSKMLEICDSLGGIYYKMEDIKADKIVLTVKGVLEKG